MPASALLVAGGDLLHELLHIIATHKIDGGPAKSAAGQSRTQARGVSAGQFDENVQFGGAVLEILTRTFVTLEHELAELLEVAVAQCARAVDLALNLADDVHRAF